MISLIFQRQQGRRSKSSTVAAALIHVNLLLALFCILPVPTYGRGAQQDQPRAALGSLTSVGEVYVNNDPAPKESTIFSGDRIRTGEAGAASFVMSGKGTLKIAPQSQIVLSGSDQFAAELEAGKIALNTISGPNGLSLRVGDYVVVPYSQKQSTTLEVTRAPNGAVVVYCIGGTAGVLTLEGQVGQYLQSGQAMTFTEGSSLLPTKKSGIGSHPGWLLGGLAGAGAAAAIAFLARGNTGQSISPSVP